MQTESRRPPQHPDLAVEQAVIDHAYQRLEEIRAEATARAETAAAERLTHFQLAFERDVVVQAAYERAASLDIGDQSLVFGRIDQEDEERYYIGRRAVFDRDYRPLVIDWRVPSAEPFYRGTGRHPMGLRLRRHFLCENRELLAIEDELFGEGRDLGLAGSGALLAAMERPRTGHMRDIVATVQAEQDEVIRDDLAGVLIVQGGPGTGKTAVGLHRAAYLLFTHRRKLERQGILVIGPTPRFLRYIDQVLPALGEGGVDLQTPAGLAPAVELCAQDPENVARLKGDERMATVLQRALGQRQHAPSRGLGLDFEGIDVTLSKREVSKLVASASRTRRRTHNARRAMLLNILVQRLRRRYELGLKKRHGELAAELRLPRREAASRLREEPALQDYVDSIWPLLKPQELVGELLASREQLRATGSLSDQEVELLAREERYAWTPSDIPLLDEAAALLGAPVDRRRIVTLDDDETDEAQTYGHIIVDEAQDLTPMTLRMLARRSRTGSMTLVGDLAQTVGATLPHSWDEVLAHLPVRDGARVRELTVNYRTPGPIMDAAVRLLADAAPELSPPRSARPDGEPISYVSGDASSIVAEAAADHRARGEGTMCVIADRSMLEQLRAAAADTGRDDTFAIIDVQEAKGLEFDRVIVVEPARIVGGTAHGMRALYVAITRATKHVTIAHAEPLPDALIPRAGR